MAGRRIDDHNSWVGKGSNGTVFPAGAKTKQVSSAEGFGALAHYEDTNETIVKQQDMAKSKVHSHPQREYYRN